MIRKACVTAIPAHWSRRLLFPVVLLGIGTSGFLTALADDPPKPEEPAAAAPTAKAEKPPAEPSFEVRANDGSLLHVKLRDAEIPLATDFGTLRIPIAKIRRIEFAGRIPDSVTEQVKAAISKLGAPEYEAREAASAELLALKEAAFAGLREAAKHEDPEVARRAEVLLEQITTAVGEEEVELRDEDLIYTDSSQIAGRIELPALQLETGLFGKQEVKLNLLRRLSSGTDIEGEPQGVMPDPGTLSNYQNAIGQTLNFRVTGPQPGANQGSVWGSGVYTYDSSLAMAAVHAGVVTPGQTKVVAVTVLGPQPGFAGSNQNGVASSAWGNYPCAFTFKPVKNAGGAHGAAPNFRAVPAQVIRRK